MHCSADLKKRYEDYLRRCRPGKNPLDRYRAVQRMEKYCYCIEPDYWLPEPAGEDDRGMFKSLKREIEAVAKNTRDQFGKESDKHFEDMAAAQEDGHKARMSMPTEQFVRSASCQSGLGVRVTGPSSLEEFLRGPGGDRYRW